MPIASWSQQTTSPQQTKASSPRRARVGNTGGTSGGGSARGGNSSGVTAMSELPCPKGFSAQTDSGPHLETAAPAERKAPGKKGSAEEAAPPAKRKTMARRCVPDKPRKTAAAPGKKRTQSP